MTIWDTLKAEVEKLVTKIKPEAVLPGEFAENVLKDAVDNAYYDTAEFFAWYYNPDDERTNYLTPVDNAPDSLVKAVRATVVDNLPAMADTGEIPEGVEPNVDEITANLVGHIMTWQDWYYDRKKSEDMDTYFERQDDWENLKETTGFDDEAGEIYNEVDFPY